MEKENKKRNYKLLLSILITILVLAGSTYAAWYYLTERTDIVMNIDGDRINFNTGGDMTITNMLPVYTMEEGEVKDIEIYKENDNYTAGINLYMNLKTWPIELSDNSFRWALYKNGNYMTSGSFVNRKQGDTIKLTSNTQRLNTVSNKDTYRLYLWIDAYQESNINMMNKTFTVSIYGQASFYDVNEEGFAPDSTPNAPDLIEGMIPIKYDYSTDEWVKADSTNTNNDWYNYEEQYWANVALVDSSKRDTYMTASNGTTIPQSDILAYYVWIPRYKYMLFNTNSNKDPQEIQIVFQSKTDTIENGTTEGEYLTHPAFWWDNNSDGVRDSSEELSGIWVGKFETGGTSAQPLIMPNILSLTNYNVSSLFIINRKFGTTTYLTENGVSASDSHMMKNMEWGAVAYLSHSRFGINTEECINNSSGYYTGRSGGNVGGNSSAAAKLLGTYTYNDFILDTNGNITTNKEAGKGACASTTGNMTGVYDMSGGAYEYVMGVQKSSAGAIAYYSSVFNASTMPASKYYDLYDYGTVDSDYTRRKLGDATGETRGWYSDYSNFITSSRGWFVRGGRADNGANAGSAAFHSDYGNASVNDGSRAVLLKP